MTPWAEIFAAAERTHEFARLSTKRLSWRMKGGRNERSGDGWAARVHPHRGGHWWRVVGEFVCTAARRIEQRACHGRKRVSGESVCAHRNRRERHGDRSAFGNGAGSLHVVTDAFERGVASGLVENSCRSGAGGQSVQPPGVWNADHRWEHNVCGGMGKIS